MPHDAAGPDAAGPDDRLAPLPTLADLVADELDGLADVERTSVAGTTTYARAGRPFAWVATAELEVRLESLVAQAALRTPDASASDRGPSWVRFAPRTLDRFAADRATAWIEHAWRHAGD